MVTIRDSFADPSVVSNDGRSFPLSDSREGFGRSRREMRPRSVHVRGCALFRPERCVDPIYRAPSMKCVFQTLLDATRTKHVGYINGDIILFRDFLDTLAAIERDHDRFFMVGRRRNALPAAQEEISHVRGEREWGKLE